MSKSLKESHDEVCKAFDDLCGAFAEIPMLKNMVDMTQDSPLIFLLCVAQFFLAMLVIGAMIGMATS